MSLKADMHMHSAMSADGEIPPEVLVANAAADGVQLIAITDHNRVDGVETALAAGKKHAIAVVPGIEIDCDFGDIHLHILGYGIEYTHPDFAALWREVKEKECAASELLMDRVEELGIALDRDAIRKMAGDGPVIGEHIAEAALDDGRNAENVLLSPFRPGGDRSDNPYVNFYWDICGRGKPAHVPVQYIGLEDCIGLITDAGGTPVLAHPGQNIGERPESLSEIARKGVKGVEAFSSYHSPETCLYWKRAAEEKGLFVTCGSDFHGKTKPAIAIGGHGAGNDVEEMLAGFLEQVHR